MPATSSASVSLQVPIWQRPRHERYMVLESIGEGTYGMVAMAIDQLTNRRVAIKTQDVKTESCTREFALLNALGAHPSDHVVAMLDYYALKGTDGRSHLCTVHPLADSSLWHVYLASHGQLPDERLAHLARGAAMGLKHLHTLSVVHGDASLKNMLLTREDVVQVADFGAAHSARGILLPDGDEITTRYVRAPERLLGDPNVQPPLDVWAFGVQVLLLRSGECQWMSRSKSDVDIAKHLSCIAQFIGQIPADCILTRLPKWSGVVGHLEPPPMTLGKTRMSGGLQSVLEASLRWAPESRAQWAAILALPFFFKPAGQARQGDTPPLGAAPTPTKTVASEAPSGRLAKVDPQASRQPQNGLGLATCSCLGNCGSRLHKGRANSRYRGVGSSGVVCEATVEKPGQYGARCRCERVGCVCARTHRRRWCRKHVVPEAEEAASTHYVSPAGVMAYPRKWPGKVHMLARVSFLYEFMEPDDLTALRTFSRKHDVLGTEVLDPFRFAALFMAHIIKWPPAVAKWSALLSENPHDGSSARGLVSILRQVIAWCDGKRWPRMFSCMNSKLMDAQTGLAVHCARLGLVARCDDQVFRMTSKTKQPQVPQVKRPRGGEEGRRFALGRAGTEYVELLDSAPAEAVVQHLVDAVSEAKLSLPQASVDAPAFADKLLEVINAARSYKSGSAHLKGGDSGYNSKHLLRAVLLEIERDLPEMFDSMPFSRLSDWCPDESNNAEHLGNCTAGYVRHHFGTSPLMWHCWACLLGIKFDDAKAAAALEVDDAVLWEPILKHEARSSPEADSFTPGPHIIWDAIVECLDQNP